MSKQRRAITSQIGSPEDEIIKQLKKKAPAASTGEKATKRVTLDIPVGLHDQIKAHTKARGLTIKGYLLFLASQDMQSA